MSVNGLQASNINFQKFVNFVDANPKTSDKSLVKLQGVRGHEICMKSAQDDGIGGLFSGWFRSSGQQTVNNCIRNAFLKSVLKKCHVKDASLLPPEVKKAMALDDYNGIFGSAKSLTDKGGSTTGKPLTLRRIRAVVQAVKDYEARTQPERIKGVINELKQVFQQNKVKDIFAAFRCFCDTKKQYDESLGTIKYLTNRICDGLKDVDFTKINTEQRVRKFIDEFSDFLLFEGDKVNTNDKFLVENMTKAAIRACQRLIPKFRAFVKENQNTLEKIGSMDYLDGKGLGDDKGGRINAIAQNMLAAKIDEDVFRALNQVVQHPEKLKKLDAQTFMRLCDYAQVYTTGNFKRFKGLVLSYIHDQLKPGLMRSDAVDFIQKLYPGSFHDSGGASGSNARIALQAIRGLRSFAQWPIDQDLYDKCKVVLDSLPVKYDNQVKE